MDLLWIYLFTPDSSYTPHGTFSLRLTAHFDHIQMQQPNCVKTDLNLYFINSHLYPIIES